MRATLLLLGLILTPDDTGEQYFKFPKDTTWNYTMKGSEDQESLTLTVTGEADGKVSANMVGKGDNAKNSKLVWYVDNGVLFWGEKKGDKLKDTIGLYKLGSKKGDTWGLAAKDGNPAQTAKHLGTEEVKVAAGVYKDAVHVQIDLTFEAVKFSMDVYLVEKVGVVKMAYNAENKQMSLELDAFKPAK